MLFLEWRVLSRPDWPDLTKLCDIGGRLRHRTSKGSLGAREQSGHFSDMFSCASYILVPDMFSATTKGPETFITVPAGLRHHGMYHIHTVHTVLYIYTIQSIHMHNYTMFVHMWHMDVCIYHCISMSWTCEVLMSTSSGWEWAKHTTPANIDASVLQEKGF